MMLGNPLVMIEYFHNIINTIIQTLLKRGMFDELIHHYGSIEYLSRRFPHTYLVIYILRNMYSADDLIVDQGHHLSRFDSQEDEE